MKSAERIMAEALILGADVVTAAEGLLEGQCKILAWHCPYCGKTMLSKEEAFQHDSECEKHPMAERVAMTERFAAHLLEQGRILASLGTCAINKPEAHQAWNVAVAEFQKEASDE